VWVSDVFVWRASPAAWSEALQQITKMLPREATGEERKKLHRLADDPAVVTMTTSDGETFDVAAAPDMRAALLGSHVRDAPDVEAVVASPRTSN